MPLSAWVILILLFALTSAVGVVTGSNSLVTVPVMFQFGDRAENCRCDKYVRSDIYEHRRDDSVFAAGNY